MIPKIAILGDFNPLHPTLHALNDSSRNAQKFLNTEIQFDWISSDIFNSNLVFGKLNYLGLWIAPGSPYRDFRNVLRVIEYARNNQIATLGNCGGFQHMIIEFAKNVCGLENADHEETNPNSKELVIKKLNCSLVGEEENLKIIDKESIIYRTLDKEDFVGKYFCNYGVNEDYISILEEKGLIFNSKSEDGEFRSFEIKSHPFFVGTLFQPALTSEENSPNPIIIEFVKQCLNN